LRQICIASSTLPARINRSIEKLVKYGVAIAGDACVGSRRRLPEGLQGNDESNCRMVTATAVSRSTAPIRSPSTAA
jgi:hypothetical protein